MWTVDENRDANVGITGMTYDEELWVELWAVNCLYNRQQRLRLRERDDSDGCKARGHLAHVKGI